jgi:hypothetical protein
MESINILKWTLWFKLGLTESSKRDNKNNEEIGEQKKPKKSESSLDISLDYGFFRRQISWQKLTVQYIRNLFLTLVKEVRWIYMGHVRPRWSK